MVICLKRGANDLDMVQLIPSLVKSRMIYLSCAGFRLTQVVPEKRLLKWK